jgi:septal ring factor EnvC (AmiA/AmiB activator)
METLPLSITNLKHDSQAEYGSFAAATQPSRARASLAPLLQVPPPAVASLETFASETQGQLDALVAEVEAQRREEAQLLAEIKPLRERLAGVLAPNRAA